MRWDLFCRVVDNWGDAGVCWRLAADLAARGESVRLWIDDPQPLTWMAPRGAERVDVVPWQVERPAALEPQDVVIEAFGCDPPAAFVARMAARERPPLWINLEDLSAEPYAEASHGLPSPQLAGPGRGLVKWFWFPGAGARSGGLIREPALLEARAAFERDAWRAAHGIEARAGERLVSLFCYRNERAPRLLDDLAGGVLGPALLLATPGHAQAIVDSWLDGAAERGALRVHRLGFMPQPEFDRLLWSCDFNVVRGEDSFVRAAWAGAPMLWDIYPQHDRAHERKLDAWLAHLLDGAPEALASDVRALWRGWIGAAPWPARWPDAAAWRALAASWRDRLAAQDDLGTALLRFVASKR